ncbi:hypothetical protein [Sedimenticola hydrogenitrophicus]|uniref:hypothetical protein n=1 Tax=Sedimenticola hydrogenitrophicus TaxID=2967975 RepID=UPI0021A8F237|nr:hypothetical protein [Sedimenticola hydrogenitrophicus]
MSILSWKRPDLPGLILLLHAVVSLAGEVPQPAGLGVLATPSLAADDRRPHSEMWLEVQVNGTAMARPAHLVELSDGRLFANAEDLIRWRIRLPGLEAFSLRGKEYYPLNAIEGLEYEVEQRTQMLLIDSRPEAFAPTRISARRIAYSAPAPASAGAFLNYDLQYQRQVDAQRLDSLFELGLFNNLGFGTANFLGQNLPERDRFTRLETAWTYDEPLALRSFRLGDSVGRTGAWGRAVRFGGVQWGTDFATRPDVVSFPLPTITGEAVLPSTAARHGERSEGA